MQADRRLLQDALDIVLADPAASGGWHRLLACQAACGLQDSAAIRQALLDGVPGDGIAGFLCATYLAGLDADPAQIARAGRLLQHIRPLHAERLMGFFTFEWARALAGTGDRAGFVARLRQAGLPQITAIAGTLLDRAAPLPAPRRAALHRVALLAPFLGQAGHAPTDLALQHAAILRGQGLEVGLFAPQDLLMPDMAAHLGHAGQVATAAPDPDGLAARLPPGVAAALGDPRFSLARRWRDMLATVAAFDPDLVLFVGLHAPMLAPLHRARPVLGLCVHAVPPMAPVDVWLAAEPADRGDRVSPWAPSLPAAWGHPHPFRIARPAVTGRLTRAALGLSDRAIVLVTVGARLAHEIEGDWAARMVALLHADPRLVWLLAGGTGALPPALAGLPADRLVLLPHRPDLAVVLRCCDICLNPPRPGGGFSVAEAMAEGLPVLALAGADGGSKLGRHAVPDMGVYFARLRALLDRPELRRAAGAEMQALFAATLDLAQSAPSLLDACALAQDRFRARAALP